MSILLVTGDDDAADALTAALGRIGEAYTWVKNEAEGVAECARRDPVVVVTDVALAGYVEFVESIARAVPWRRTFLLLEPPRPSAILPLVPVIEKPFDASEFAALLSRERQVAEADRRERKAQALARENALLVEASFEAIIGLAADGTVISWNPGAQQVYGYSAAEVVGEHVSLLEFDAAASAGPPTLAHAVEARRRRRDGREVLVLLSRSKVEPASSETRLAFAEVSLDITARRFLERELEHSKRLATIGRLSASMSHEINNPLTVVRASSGWVRERAELAEDATLLEAAKDIELAAARIAQFSEQVCGFARRNQAQVQNAPIQPTLEMALRMVRPRATEKKVEINLIAHNAGEVPHDAPRLAQVLINLLANAIDAAAEGGRQVTVRAQEDANYVCIEIDDNGPGIAEEIRDHLFQPFTTTKPFGKGTGLGLALSRKIMEDHRGTIDLNSLPSGGTRAQIKVPRTTHDSKRPAAQESSSHA
ncbi:MAG TPA: ATP-binding protein [Polyangiaceae bacterium]|nr:ATP-binding protein [Polyangiaceae bacterium]